MLATANFVRETLASAPGTSAFNLPNSGSSGGPYRSFNAAFGTSGPRAVFYVARTSTQFEAGYGYHDPSGNSGSGQIIRSAANVTDGSSGAGSLVNFTSAPDVYLDFHAQAIGFVGQPNALAKTELFEDFLAFNVGTKFGTNASGTGAAVGSSTSGVTGGSEGTMSAQTGTTATGAASLQLNSSNSTANVLLQFGKGIAICEFLIRLPQANNAAGSDTFDMRWGFTASGSSDPNQGVWFQYGQQLDTALGNTGRIGLCWSKLSSVQARVDSGQSMDAAGGWHRYRIEVRDDASRADFFVDGVNIGNITATLPTFSNSNMVGLSAGITRASGNTGTATRFFVLDYIAAAVYPNAARG